PSILRHHAKPRIGFREAEEALRDIDDFRIDFRAVNARVRQFREQLMRDNAAAETNEEHIVRIGNPNAPELEVLRESVRGNERLRFEDRRLTGIVEVQLAEVAFVSNSNVMVESVLLEDDALF